MTLGHGGMPASPPERGEPWYRMELRFRAEGAEPIRIPITIVPRLALMRWEGEHGDQTWVDAPAETLASFRRLSKGIAPFPAGTLELGDTSPAEAQVDEVVSIADPAEPPSADAQGSGGSAAPWIAVGIAALLAAILLLLRRAGGIGGARAKLSKDAGSKACGSKSRPEDAGMRRFAAGQRVS